jgi:hypothetical protein
VAVPRHQDHAGLAARLEPVITGHATDDG